MCTCYSDVENKIADRYRLKLNGSDVKAKISQIGFSIDEKGVLMRPYVPVKVTADASGFRRGKDINMYFSFCPFCGEEIRRQ